MNDEWFICQQHTQYRTNKNSTDGRNRKTSEAALTSVTIKNANKWHWQCLSAFSGRRRVRTSAVCLLGLQHAAKVRRCLLMTFCRNRIDCVQHERMRWWSNLTVLCSRQTNWLATKLRNYVNKSICVTRILICEEWLSEATPWRYFWHDVTIMSLYTVSILWLLR